MPDLIPREAAIAAIEKLESDVRSQLMAEGDSYQQVLIKRRILGIQQSKAAVADIPAAGEQSIEKAIEEIDDLRCKLFGEGNTDGESALHTALSILDKHLNPAAPSEQD